MTDNKQHCDDRGNSETPLDAAVWAVISEPIDREAIQRVKARAARLSENSQPKVQRATLPPMDRRRVYALSSLAAAIVLVVGAVLFLSPTRSAFAMAMEQLKAAGAFRYTELIYTDQKQQPIETHVMVAADGRQRSEMGGTVSIMDSAGQLRLTLLESRKKAIMPQHQVKIGPDMGQRQLRWLEELRSHRGEADKKLDAKVLDGRKVEGFVVDQGQHAFTIWVDAGTHELVQIEHDSFVEGSSISKVVMKDFRFNETLAPSLFSFDVPDGYQVTALPPAPKPLPAEESIVEALRGYTKEADGKFPKSLTNWGEWAVLFSKKEKNGKLSQETVNIMSRLGAIVPFLTGMSKDDYEYLGAGKTTSDKRTIVFWRRTKDGTIRAIFNDFAVSVIDEQDLPGNKNKK
jgi:hypothetical protein